MVDTARKVPARLQWKELKSAEQVLFRGAMEEGRSAPMRGSRPEARDRNEGRHGSSQVRKRDTGCNRWEGKVRNGIRGSSDAIIIR